jgi:hypothetical protein
MPYINRANHVFSLKFDLILSGKFVSWTLEHAPSSLPWEAPHSLAPAAPSQDIKSYPR